LRGTAEFRASGETNDVGREPSTDWCGQALATSRRRVPDCRVLVDANDTYTVDEMIGYVKAVADCDLYWIEEPFEENRA
jgi:L-alanine-DL-glutamate epimerase-like enolase superfamily enzyme